MKTYQSFSSEETKKLGEKFARGTKQGKNALVFALQGELGAGKTTFVQGFFKGLGLKKHASSPTFVIMRRHILSRTVAHKIPHKRFSNVFHVDAYRIKNANGLRALGFKDILVNPRNIVLIEWAGRVREILPKDAVWLKFRHGRHENERHIMIRQRHHQ